MDEITCDKNCIANLNGKCCADECKGQISSLKPREGTAEILKTAYEAIYEAINKLLSFDTTDYNDEDS